MLFRQSSRALVAWMGAGLAALVAAHTVATDLATLHRRARAAGDEVAVVVARRDLPLGTSVAAADLRVERRYERHLPPAAQRDRDAVAGRVVTSPVLKGSVVTDRHLAPRGRTGLDGVVPPGMRAVRVATEDGVIPPPGAVVDVLVTFDPAVVPPGEDATVEAVKGALVIESDADTDHGDGFASPAGARSAVTLLTDTEGARRLAYAAANGIVTLALVPPEEACCPTSKKSSSGSSRG